ncbi:RND family efflux transporter MFP subunit [Wenyingzhuangia heitensis]|uniref:RND family efflux transporter MFP subunit n=1 Tax=Wenyingzhuangia heitensis TaxID=1487859 RepID=A0ABX0UEV6_9FLAO|nr:efflux RND transporter periplasmic adaptor subunit [Wenyingzhuangia heitensis]NIJ46405.1 RND family efflux transporter MFP subunit [Wenyingzhuangia heitensis]
MKKYIIKSTLIIGLLVAVGCSKKETKATPVATVAPTPKIETFELKKDKLSSEVVIPAEITAFQYVDLYAKVNSYVKELKVDIGSVVKKGAVLVVLEAPELTSKLIAAEAQLHAQEAVYMASNSTYNRLLETSKIEGTISKNEIEQALAVKNADFAKLQAAKAMHKEYEVMQSYLEIKAPFNGVITARNIHTGAYVGPSGKGSVLPLLELQDVNKLRLTVSVPESYTGFLDVNVPVNFKIHSLPNHQFSANITRKSGVLDKKLRSERVEIDLENNPVLKPGMVAEVTIPLTPKDSTFVVPKTSVLTYSEGTFVIKSVGGKAHKVAVKKRRETADFIEVFSKGLNTNDQLVKVASEEIREGVTLAI